MYSSPSFLAILWDSICLCHTLSAHILPVKSSRTYILLSALTSPLISPHFLFFSSLTAIVAQVSQIVLVNDIHGDSPER